MGRSRRVLPALATGVMLVAAACGSSTKSSSGAGTTAGAVTTKAATVTTAASTATTAGPATTAKATATTATASGADAQKNTQWVADAEAAAKAKPLKATGDAVVIGFQNPEGDPAGSFPEYRQGAEAAVKYINEELGGVGSDPKNGKPGRPLKLEPCKMAIAPADSQRCANELAAKKPALVLSSLNFFGNHFAVYKAANIPVLVGTPITALDFTSPGVYAVGGGGGCLGAHTALIRSITKELGKKRIAVPWADTPPGVFCYHDLEKKSLEVLAGKKLDGSAIKADGNSNKGSIADLQHIGVPIKPGQADVTPQATQVLDFKPDGIVFSAQGADCWTFVSALSKLGWKNDATPLVLTGACIDLAKMKELDTIAKGIYFVGNGAPSLLDTTNSSPADKQVGDTYTSRMAKYAEGGAETAGKGFATQGFTILMQIWDLMGEQSGYDATKIDVAAYTKLLGATEGRFQWGGTGLNCSQGTTNAPYVAVCNATANLLQWDGKSLVPKTAVFSAIDLIKGTDLDFGK